jgi:predicted Zn finger-like uncharacterized protein
MPISISCNDCGSKYKVADAAAGKKVKCKKCGTIMAIPALVPAGNDDSGPMLGFRDDAPAPKPAPVPRPSVRPTAAARPAAKPAAPAARPKPPAVKRPAPPPPPSDDHSLDDLAALAHGDLLPPEELPTAPASRAPVFRPPATSAPARGHAATTAPLGYATRRPTVMEQPAYIGQWGGLLMLAVFVAPLINGILLIIIASQHAKAGEEINIGAAILAVLLETGIGVIRTCISAAIMLWGIKIAGAIMKFSAQGGYSSVLMILGWPSLLSIAFIGFLAIAGSPENLTLIVAAGAVTIALALVGSIRLLKDAFVLTWGQTAVAIGMIIALNVAIVLVLLVVVVVIAGGFAVLSTRF